MTTTSLVTALAVGITLGLIGAIVVPRDRVPSWVTPAAAAAAVLLGSLLARSAGLGVDQFSTGELVIQVVFGICAVVLVAAAADRRPSRRRGRDHAADTQPGRRR